jgi:AraC-like DNA-binding protein
MGHWTTAGLAPEEQQSYWADVVCKAFTPLTPHRALSHREGSAAPNGVPGWVTSSPLGPVNTAEISSCTQLLVHGRREVAQSSDDVYFVNLQLAGSCLVEQDDKRCVVEEGSFAVVDARRPFTQEYRETAGGQPWRVLSFRIPHSHWTEAASASVAIATPVSTTRGDGVAVGSLMTALWAERAELSVAASQAMGRAFAHTLAATVSVRSNVESLLEHGGVNDAVVRVARAYIREALPSGRVTALEAARRVSMSVRSLHRAFQAQELTFAECVREERFLGAKSDLEHPVAGRSVADVAARWGFCDSSHLTRTFKRRLGCTPTEYRAQRLLDVISRPIAP